MPLAREVKVGERPVTIEEVVAVGRGAAVALSRRRAYRDRIDAGARAVESIWRGERPVYGITTGYGASCTVSVSPELAEELPERLVRFHGCGLGAAFPKDIARSIMAVRLVSLARGLSGVRFELLERLQGLVNRDIVPVIPQEGSVGASGDLTPLSYVAAVLMGERRVFKGEGVEDAAKALRRAGLKPLRLAPKEALALMNGTSAMTGAACHAFDRAAYLARLASRITSLAVAAMEGNAAHFDKRLFLAKPHPGQLQSAAWIRDDLRTGKRKREGHPIQDPYSLRCAPHVIGVLLDALPWMRSSIEVEINSSNDNPLIDPDDGHVMHGGHFYGGHIAFAMDALKIAVASVADLMDRQIALVMNQRTSHGLPANLSGAIGDRSAINHGLKAVQIAASAWTAEALSKTTSATIFSRSTECHNQDKVSMGTIAARDCLRVIELTEQVAAAALFSFWQAISLRLRSTGTARPDFSPALREMMTALARDFTFLNEDRALEPLLRLTLEAIREQKWSLYR